VIDTVEKFLQIKIHHPAIPVGHIAAGLFQSLVGPAARTEAIAALRKVRIEDWYQDLHYRLGNQPVKGSGNPEHSRSASRLRQIYCPNRSWNIGLAQELLSNRGPGLPKVFRKLLDAHAVDSRSPFVGLYPS
jgi:hypothetical protein